MTGKIRDKDYTAICSEKTLQSNEKGFFMQFVENVSEEAGEEWIRKTFGRLKSDKERIRIIYNHEPVKAAVYHTLSHVQEIYRQKSSEVSQARRLTAEQLFRKGEIQKSLTLYSQSILRSSPTGENPSVDGGKSLALAFWGRSQVLMAMNLYDAALADIQVALKENLNDSYKTEAFKTMGICYKALGQQNQAKVSFGLAEKLLLNDEKRLADLRRVIQLTYKQENLRLTKVLPPITGENHPKYPNASGKIYVKQAKGLGRFMTAQDHVKTGDVLVVEPPYAACLLPEFFGTHCHHCFERLAAPVGCLDCCSVAFCRNECRNAALATYHRFECKYLDLLIGSGMSILAHTSLRMITQNALERTLDVYENRNLEKVYGSCTNDELRRPEDFFQRTLMACFLLRCLQKSGYFPDRKCEDCTPSEDELRVGELLLLHLQILQFNAHEIYETRRSSDQKFADVKASYIGVAIYPTSALFNHSCYPAVTRHFVGKNIVLTAVRPIGPGEVISENYGPVFTRRKLSDRQKSLAARYWFDCQCVACVQDWPSLDTGLESVSKKIRCPTQRCTFFFVLPIANENMKCPRCKKNVCLAENVALLGNCEGQLKEAFESADKGDFEKGISLLVQAIETFHKISVPPHRDVHLGQELLRTFLAETGNVHVNA